jgi:hypothetical protein
MRTSACRVAFRANDISAAWPGRQSDTRTTLLAIFARAVGSDSEFSVAKRGLLMACEFWAAVNTGTLAQHLGAEASDHLYIVSTVFAAIGAKDVASATDTACTDLTGVTHYGARRQCIGTLETYLLASTDPVDAQLAKFALQLMGTSRKRQWLARMPAHS